jgi:enterochelin esterase-like enzyme
MNLRICCSLTCSVLLGGTVQAYDFTVEQTIPFVECRNDEDTQQIVQRMADRDSDGWLENEELLFAKKSDAQSVQILVAGQSFDMTRLDATNVWVFRFKKPGLDEGVASYSFLEMNDGRPIAGPMRAHTWRGPHAPPSAEIAAELKGRFEVHDFESQQLEAKRKVYVYIPPGDQPLELTIYMADGQGASSAAAILEPLILNGSVPRTAIVGAANGGYLVDSHGGSEPYEVKKDLRASEYLPGYDLTRFQKHSEFFRKELSLWAETTLRVPKGPSHRIVYGFSNGGRFAATMGLNHDAHFGYSIAFSVAGEHKPHERYGNQCKFFLAAGEWETEFHANTLRLKVALEQAKTSVRFVSRKSGHDYLMWQDELANAMLEIAKEFRSKVKEP